MRRGVVDRNAGVFSERDDNECHERERERDAEAGIGPQHVGRDRGELSRACEQRERENRHQHGRLRERGEHHFAARADPAKTRADIEPGEREQEARGAEQGDDHDEICGRTQGETRRKRRDQRGGDPGRRKDDVGCGTKQPRCILGDDGLFADQFREVAIRLNDRRTLSAQEPCPDLARHARQERCEGEHEGGLRKLCEPGEHHRHAPTTISSRTSAANTSVRYVRIVRNCTWFKRSAMVVDRANHGVR